MCVARPPFVALVSVQRIAQAVSPSRAGAAFRAPLVTVAIKRVGVIASVRPLTATPLPLVMALVVVA